MVAGLHLIAGDIDATAIHENVTVVDHLAGCLAGITEASTVADVVEAALEELEEDDTRDTAAAGCFLIVSAELLLEDAVLETELLLLAEGDGVFGLLLAACADAVLAGREVAALQGLGGAEKRDAEAAGKFGAGTCVACHDV
jgi:hypothetical protein